MQNKCQVFTPDGIVGKLLDEIGYHKNLFGKKVYENSCGTGNILVEIVKRYIEDCNENGLSDNKIKAGLEHDIFAADIDAKCCTKAIERLNGTAASYGIQNVRWNVSNIDSLFETNGHAPFDYIVGNPPYVSYKDIDCRTRKELKKNFMTCSNGKFDYYYAFFEKAISQLSSNGRLAYIVPNSCFKNVFAFSLREMIKPLVTKIVDYKNQQLFDALTSSAIIVLSKHGNNGLYSYSSAKDDSPVTLPTETLDKTKWSFNSQFKKRGNRLFGEDYRVMNSIATLCNGVFIIDSSEIEKREPASIRLYDGSEIEVGVLKKACSPKSMRLNKVQYAIFPYDASKHATEAYSESRLSQDFPSCYRYLRERKPLLDNRTADAKARWYEYGRRQGLNTVGERKLIMSTVVTDSVHVYEVGADSVAYAGIIITCRSKGMLTEAKAILESQNFLDYVHDIGTNVSGNSLRITARDVSSYEYR